MYENNKKQVQAYLPICVVYNSLLCGLAILVSLNTGHDEMPTVTHTTQHQDLKSLHHCGI